MQKELYFTQLRQAEGSHSHPFVCSSAELQVCPEIERVEMLTLQTATRGFDAAAAERAFDGDVELCYYTIVTFIAHHFINYALTPIPRLPRLFHDAFYSLIKRKLPHDFDHNTKPLAHRCYS